MLILIEKEVQTKMKKLTQDIATASSRLSEVTNQFDDYLVEKKNNVMQMKSSRAELEATQVSNVI